MMSGFATKLALKKVGLPSNILDMPGSTSGPAHSGPNKLRKQPPDPYADNDAGWGSWMSVKSLPLSVQPWLSPPPPPVALGRVPGIGAKAPTDSKRRLVLGGGRRTLVVFLRCVGCAFAQKTFLNLRSLANRYDDALTCIAVSHASDQATRKWIDLLGGAWTVRVIIDEERELYAAWGLGLSSVWHLFNPTSQAQGWRETGWLGNQVADAITRRGIQQKPRPLNDDGEEEDGPMTVMGNKWQEAGAFAIDGAGNVIWGGKALRADDVLDLENGAKVLMA